MLNEAALRRALHAAGLDAPVRWDDVTDSTHRTAMGLATAGAPAWTLVGAGHQTAGRGRAGRTWVDRPGAAVMLSLVLRPTLAADRLGVVSLAAGITMADAVGEAGGPEVRCKWPNDLLVDGAKVGGILATSGVDREASPYVVLGIGVNLEPPDGVAGAAGIGHVDEEVLVAAFVARLASLLDEEPDAIVDAWRVRSDTLGRRVEATTVEGVDVRGVAADVDATGALLVDGDADAGRVRVAFGDVTHLRADAG
ncbi:MAG TPA: biotin--[acetyl-CoA-carboxylase] ligase [Actinomycetota bacterium]|nr:biotin--[acetyl-CoA-carboxylase] ligase [Actinomycetota bacterium]